VQRNCSEDGPGIRTTVFFKGCPLRCVWCQNPEGMRPWPEPMGHGGERCTVGRWVGRDELLREVLVDEPFFRSTGGGVTLSGGEPAAQTEFASRFLRALRRRGVGTAMETCGSFSWQRFEHRLLPYLDHVYFDLKLFDDEESRLYTGRSNRRIVENFRRLWETAPERLHPRIPLVPGLTTRRDNLRSWAVFLRRLGVERCTLMPYNPLWLDKLEALGHSPTYVCKSFMTPQEEAACVAAFAA
jgi:pyruvate formate lyase activating enzyme